MRMEKRINVKMMETKEVNSSIKKSINGSEGNEILISNASKLDNIAVGLNRTVNIVIRNDVGDLIGALNNGASIKVEGNAGRYAADGMTAGEVIIEGDVDEGAGSAMCGGTLVIKGNAKDRVGQLLKGGRIIVLGSVGDYSGSFMIAGNIIIGGDAGLELGGSMVAGAIYIRGDYERLGTNLKQTDLTNEDVKFLKEMLERYQIAMKPQEFRKIIPQEKKLA
jgi:glutamate synthase domain-containing protein 3